MVNLRKKEERDVTEASDKEETWGGTVNDPWKTEHRWFRVDK